MADDTTPSWGYSKKDAQIFDLAPGESLPKGYYPNPAMVPGSDAEKAYRDEAAREGAPVPWDPPAAPAAPAATDTKA